MFSAYFQGAKNGLVCHRRVLSIKLGKVMPLDVTLNVTNIAAMVTFQVGAKLGLFKAGS